MAGEYSKYPKLDAALRELKTGDYLLKVMEDCECQPVKGNKGWKNSELWVGNGVTWSVDNSSGNWIACNLTEADKSNEYRRADVIQFWRNENNLDFFEAVTDLCSKFHLENPFDGLSVKRLKKSAAKKIREARKKPSPQLRPIAPVKKEDYAGIEEQLKPYGTCYGHWYLERDRGILPETVSHPRFKGRVLEDFGLNLAFPHYCRTPEGWVKTGFERRFFYRRPDGVIEKKKGFNGGGKRGLWFSNADKKDKLIIVAEAAIDALSYFQLKQTDACYASTGGTLSQQQLAIFRYLLGETERRLLLIFDNDIDGRRYRDMIKRIPHKRGRVKVEHPPLGYADWNDFLNGKKEKGWK